MLGRWKTEWMWIVRERRHGGFSEIAFSLARLGVELTISWETLSEVQKWIAFYGNCQACWQLPSSSCLPNGRKCRLVTMTRPWKVSYFAILRRTSNCCEGIYLLRISTSTTSGFFGAREKRIRKVPDRQRSSEQCNLRLIEADCRNFCIATQRASSSLYREWPKKFFRSQILSVDWEGTHKCLLVSFLIAMLTNQSLNSAESAMYDEYPRIRFYSIRSEYENF